MSLTIRKGMRVSMEDQSLKNRGGPVSGTDKTVAPPGTPATWEEIHQLEMLEDYPAVIDALENRLAADSGDHEAVIRLGFNLWIAGTEALRTRDPLPEEQCALRFMELFLKYGDSLHGNADFCHVYGLALSIDGWSFPGGDQKLGEVLLQRAAELDPFYVRLGQDEMTARFAGRGVFALYYGINQ